MGIRVSTAAPVNPDGFGSILYDQHGLKSYGELGSIHSQRGGKGVNQDSAVIYQGYGSEDGVFCGVFDGHGKNGHFVSRIIRARLALLLLDQKNAITELDTVPDENDHESRPTDDTGLSVNKKMTVWKDACKNAFKEMDKEIKLVKKLDSAFSGSTAVVVLKQDDELLIANLGDSRAILGTKAENGVKAVQLTIDLKPGSPDEADRIRKSNGRVFALREEPGVQRAWLPRVYSPGMAMSRAFGDFVMKNHGIICTPVITHHHITSDDLFVVLATDGVWDVLSNKEVASIVWAAESEDMAAKAVVDAAVAAWRIKMPFDKPDDCTAVCFFLQKKVQTPAAMS